MRDVAERAGVSGQTVSRVANNAGNVAEATRRRVEEAMAELGYRPNIAARALRLGSFRSIGVVMFNIETLGNVRTVSAIAGAAAARGYALELMQVDGLQADAAAGEVSWALQRLALEAVDGIIVLLEKHLATNAAIHLHEGVPSVVVDAGAELGRPAVDADQAQGTRLAVEYLLDLGHPTVRHVAGPEVSSSATAREATWRETLLELGCVVHEPLRGDWTPRSGYEAGSVLAGDPDVSAVFVANDQMALGVMRAFHERGVRIPEDVSVVGFDDMAESADFWPPLTTVHQRFEAVGSTAVELLVEQIEQGAVSAGMRRISTSLVVRESAGPYRRR
jgi:DNA-binding LacI/PurR family transcriptional regulator